jgi:hypothetical protein
MHVGADCCGGVAIGAPADTGAAWVVGDVAQGGVSVAEAFVDKGAALYAAPITF